MDFHLAPRSNERGMKVKLPESALELGITSTQITDETRTVVGRHSGEPSLDEVANWREVRVSGSIQEREAGLVSATRR